MRSIFGNQNAVKSHFILKQNKANPNQNVLYSKYRRINNILYSQKKKCDDRSVSNGFA